MVSDKILRDVVIPSGDYNDAVKYTPGYASSNPNGPLGDAKGGWRGFQDGQYNITFDGIPFGDENDPTHHSAAYFPAAFLGKVSVNRGPGDASQVGYATFGGTLALQSFELSDTFGGNVQSSYGSFSTLNASATVQTGLDKNTGVRLLMQYNHSETAGALQYNSVETNQWLLKGDRQFGDINVTAFGNYGREHYDGGNSPSVQQYYLGGPTYAALGPNPFTAQYTGYNNSEKQTDMEYINLKADYFGFHFNDKVYTYSYWYPDLQNNPANTATEGLSTAIGGADTITSVKVPLLGGGTQKLGFNVPVGDITGYLKDNNYRAWGNIFDVTRDFGAGYASGTLRTGVWWERGDNWRIQEYINYTTGVLYPAYAQTLQGAYQGAYKLNLGSHIENVQPYIEYEWKPIDNLSITPGYKFDIFHAQSDGGDQPDDDLAAILRKHLSRGHAVLLGALQVDAGAGGLWAGVARLPRADGLRLLRLQSGPEQYRPADDDELSTRRRLQVRGLYWRHRRLSNHREQLSDHLHEHHRLDELHQRRHGALSRLRRGSHV